MVIYSISTMTIVHDEIMMPTMIMMTTVTVPMMRCGTCGMSRGCWMAGVRSG